MSTASWQQYITNLTSTGVVKDAVIAGKDGNIWASSENFQPTTDELKKIAQQFEDKDACFEGVRVGGKKYIYLSSEDGKVIRAKLLKCGVHCARSGQAIIVGTYEEPIVPAQAALTIEKVCDYLSSVGY